MLGGRLWMRLLGESCRFVSGGGNKYYCIVDSAYGRARDQIDFTKYNLHRVINGS